MGKVLEVKKGTITVECKGKKRELRSKLVDVKKGDYVIFALDIAIEKIDEEEAKTAFGDMYGN